MHPKPDFRGITNERIESLLLWRSAGGAYVYIV